jgi:hypothetical protein
MGGESELMEGGLVEGGAGAKEVEFEDTECRWRSINVGRHHGRSKPGTAEIKDEPSQRQLK